MQLLWAAFLLGFAGSMHCLIMCGPLISIASKKYGNLGLGFGSGIYHSSRIFSYMIIGLIFGAFSQFLSLFFYQQVLSVLSGVLLLGWSFFYFFPGITGLSSIVLKFWSRTTSGLFSGLWKRKNIFSVAGIGMLNGFLPCGLVYLAASASINQGSILYSMTFMLIFGLGTLPAITGLILTKKMIPNKFGLPIKKLTPFFLVLLGFLFILRGLNLNIPYVSPHLVQMHSGQKDIRSQCCGKPDRIIR